MRRSQLVATTEVLINIENQLGKLDVTETCKRERENTTWKFYKLTNGTIFAALLREIPMWCKAAVILDPLLENLSVKCLTFEESIRKPYNDIMCLFRALALHLRGTRKTRRGIFQIFQSIPR